MTKSTFKTLSQSEQLISNTAEFLDQCCNKYNVHKTIKDNILILSDELLSNIKKYSYSSSKEINIRVTIDCLSTEKVELTISDNGEPFNPLTVELQDIEGAVSERNIGGLGLHLVKSLSSSQSYKRSNNYNQLTLILNE